MRRIEWTKEYPVHHEKGSFRIYLSRHSDGSYYGTVVYYSKTGSWTEEQPIDISIETHFILGEKEEQVLEQCRDWIASNLGGNYEIGEGTQRSS